jgi:drug/metabolite transporter (DMT)-like permease
MLAAIRALRTPVRSEVASPTRGILLMLATMAIFVVCDTTAKWLTRSYPVPQVVWARFAFAFLFVAALLGPRALAALRSRRLALQLARSALQIGSTTTYFFAVSLLPITTAVTVSFLQPLLITALSVPLLRERVGPRRWAAVGCGFLGVLVIVRPGTAMDVAVLLPVATAGASALYYIATRIVSRSDPVTTSLLYTALLGTVGASAILPWSWTPPDALGWCLLIAVGLLAGLGHLLVIQAYGSAPASLLAPFIYTQLIWATGLGWLIFGDLPDAWTIAGALIIVGSGLYVFHRERRLAATRDIS